ncbi:ankyrin repeat domain-containing protein [Paenibacillus sp. SC116]|uniref:ankyrin repeat domain-containing protein n=1 Tax=Paenibacillus sp. SC116 TaxID=2968986 RepID=UPI00215A25D4|nr:ankyrin repeat domain-containing protein [Paenibacillus sp. SC116]MCR8846479.1 ankyrin repeat domain-containing protein [Paenibacillus sp. SC116]
MLRAFTIVLSGIVLMGCSSEPSQQETANSVSSEQAHKQEPSPSKTGNEKVLNEALLAAAEQGETAEVLKHLKNGADINTRDKDGRTPVMLATVGNHLVTVKVLLDRGADVNIQDERKDNPYLYAGAEGLTEVLKLAIEAGADTKLTNRYGGTALIPAAEHAHLDVIEYLVQHSAVDINHVNNLGWTALMEAIVLGSGGEEHQRVVGMLIQHGADVNIPDIDGVSALEHAKSREFDEITQILVAAGAK